MTHRAFTLVELLVGMAVASIVFVAALSFYGYLIRLNSVQARTENLLQAKNDLAQELATRIRWANTITLVANNPADFLADSHAYTLSAGRIIKDGNPLTPSTVTVTKFMVTDYSTDPTKTASFLIEIDIQDAVNTYLHDTLRLVISQRQGTFRQ